LTGQPLADGYNDHAAEPPDGSATSTPDDRRTA